MFLYSVKGYLYDNIKMTSLYKYTRCFIDNDLVRTGIGLVLFQGVPRLFRHIRVGRP